MKVLEKDAQAKIVRKLASRERPKPDQNAIVLGAVAEALKCLAKVDRTITVPAPNVVVPEPRLEQNVVIQSPKAWEFTVVSRDGDGRIVKMRADRIDDE